MAANIEMPFGGEDFEMVLNDQGNITGFKNLQVTIAPNLKRILIEYCYNFCNDLIMLEKVIKPILCKLPIQPVVLPHKRKQGLQEKALTEMDQMFERIHENKSKQAEFLPCIMADIRKFISTFKGLANLIYGIEIDLDIDRILSADTEDEAKRECFNIFSDLIIAIDPTMGPVYTTHIHMTEKFEKFQNMKFSNELDEASNSYLQWCNNSHVKFTCDLTLLDNAFITPQQIQQFTSDNEVLEYISQTFPKYDVLYKIEHQLVMIVQIMTILDLPHFMHNVDTIGYMGIHYAPLVELTQNPIITRKARSDKHHGIHFDFKGEHDYFKQLYGCSPLQYLFDGDIKPAKCI